MENITAARLEREQRQRVVARQVGLADDTPFTVLLPLLPGEYRPLVQALVQENNELLKRIQRRARQNHLLLSRIVELMQRLFDPFFPNSQPVTYTDSGVVAGAGAAETFTLRSHRMKTKAEKLKTEMLKFSAFRRFNVSAFQHFS